MLVSFTLRNHRSFREEQTLSLVADSREKNHERHLTALPEGHRGHLLPLALLYGPNGSGKSNLVKGLADMRGAVLGGLRRSGRVRRPFKLDAHSESAETEYVVRFLAGAAIYEYGFEEGAGGIMGEWLIRLGDEKNDEVVFDRDGSGLEFGGTLSSHTRMLALKDLGIKRDELLVYTAAQLIDREALPAEMQEVLTAFDDLAIVYPDAEYAGFFPRLAEDPPFSAHISRTLEKADIGISKLELARRVVENDDLERALEDMAIELPSEGEQDELKVMAQLSNRAYYRKDGQFFEIEPMLHHRCADGETRTLTFAEESDGTRRLAHLAPALEVSTARTLVIDELERSLHPVLARVFLEALIESLIRSKRQAIVVTHETRLLSQEVLRRDEVWFVDKDRKTQASRLRSLSEYGARKDLRLDKGYLAGRFGAIPMVGDLAGLPEDEEMDGAS